MTKLFFDTEFTGLHQQTTLISLGIYADNGHAFYAEFTDYNEHQVDDWIRNNVLTHLRGEDNTKTATLAEFTLNCHIVGNTATIREALTKWLLQFDKAILISDCLSFDWVLLCNLFGHAFNLPKQLYYIPIDLSTLLFSAGYDPDINREEFAGIKEAPSNKHNAAWDAFVIQACYWRLENEGHIKNLKNF